MTAASRIAESWNVDGTVATLDGGALAARLDLARPELGLQSLRLRSAALDVELLRISPSDVAKWPARLADAYVRGADLVAAYEAVAEWPYATQVYWQTGASESAWASLSLLVSIQTVLLDTHPRIEICSRLAAEEMLRVSPEGSDDVHVELLPEGEQSITPSASAHGVLWRLAQLPLSYVEIMPGSDFRKLTVRSDANGVGKSRWQLFAEFLEKGVIRRARLHAAFLPREGDVALAAGACRELLRRPLPLTT